ncbi:MAG TPA: hypothetical protein VH593_06925 [Ktedonobacteraceae bacterium]
MGASEPLRLGLVSVLGMKGVGKTPQEAEEPPAQRNQDQDTQKFDQDTPHLREDHQNQPHDTYDGCKNQQRMDHTWLLSQENTRRFAPTVLLIEVPFGLNLHSRCQGAICTSWRHLIQPASIRAALPSYGR